MLRSEQMVDMLQTIQYRGSIVKRYLNEFRKTKDDNVLKNYFHF